MIDKFSSHPDPNDLSDINFEGVPVYKALHDLTKRCGQTLLADVMNKILAVNVDSNSRIDVHDPRVMKILRNALVPAEYKALEQKINDGTLDKFIASMSNAKNVDMHNLNELFGYSAHQEGVTQDTRGSNSRTDNQINNEFQSRQNNQNNIDSESTSYSYNPDSNKINPKGPHR